MLVRYKVERSTKLVVKESIVETISGRVGGREERKDGWLDVKKKRENHRTLYRFRKPFTCNNFFFTIVIMFLY